MSLMAENFGKKILLLRQENPSSIIQAFLSDLLSSREKWNHRIISAKAFLCFLDYYFNGKNITMRGLTILTNSGNVCVEL